MKIYAISGLGADYRVFEKLTLDHKLITINWVNPGHNESISDYTKRLTHQIDTSESFCLLGVSFGGVIAIELNKLIKPKFTIIISSVETCFELRKTFRIIGRTGILNMLPEKLFKLPENQAYHLFGAKNKQLLKEIIDDTDLNFTKWALNALSNWKNKTKIPNLIKISGSKDKLMPPTIGNKTILIKNGEHFMIVDKAEEISDIINLKIKEFIS